MHTYNSKISVVKLVELENSKHTTTCKPPRTLSRNNAAALRSYFRIAQISQSERRLGSGVIMVVVHMREYGGKSDQ